MHVHALYHAYSFHLFLYRIQTHQHLSTASINGHKMFANAMLQQLDAFEIHVVNIVSARFSLDGLLDKQNLCIWGMEIPLVAAPTPLHPPNVMVGATISSKGLIGPIFRHQTLLYHSIWTFYVAYKMPWKTVGTVSWSWLMQDSPRPYRTAEISFPHQTFR